VSEQLFMHIIFRQFSSFMYMLANSAGTDQDTNRFGVPAH